MPTNPLSCRTSRASGAGRLFSSIPPAPVAEPVTALLTCPANPATVPGAGLFYTMRLIPHAE